MLNLGLLFLTTSMGLSVTMAAESFLYEEDAECTFPFSAVSIDSLYCTGNQRYKSKQGNQVQQEIPDGACYFTDMMALEGSFELSQKVNRYFSATFKVCYYGSSNAFYKPTRCKTIHKSLDMLDYAVIQEEYDEEEEVKEGYDYKTYYQDEESQKWAEAQEQYQDQQDRYSQKYLYPGAYTWNLSLKVPSKSFTFDNGSELHVSLTLTPKQSYTLPYYRATTYYNAPISDSRYRTQCYLSFQAIPEYNYGNSYNFYYTAGLGFLLVGAATYVSSKRRVCTCEGRKARLAAAAAAKALHIHSDAQGMGDCYQQHDDNEFELPGRRIPPAHDGDVSLYSL